MDEGYLNMDSNLQRLKHELDCLWQTDEGLHTQMNTVIGALQELKLLQVQTALDELNFPSKTSQISPFTCAPNNHSSRETNLNQTLDSERENLLDEHCKTEFSTEPSLFLTSSPLEKRNTSRAQEPMRIQHRGSLSTSSSFSSSQEDTLDSRFSSYDNDDSSDWTSSLMNHSRNRQPLVLGDNAFADLVGNWLDLPDVGYQSAGEVESDASLRDTTESSSPTSHSHELSRRLSLTANIFKRVLRRVRPGRSNPLQDSPGQLNQRNQEMEVFKQPKIMCRKPKGDASKPFWVRTRGLRKKTTPIQQEGVAYHSSEGLMGRGWTQTIDYKHNSVVWV
ncbi:PAK4-inhibitor INKA2 isoform X1 [Misgurnus anguillicaudatus]|uniref:PAK4-inhibitor INKA2 isoform X1 n=2 Tax=Misgurnus anguillicaudatus TaxID=75329 RepID=UPI003CCF8BC9